MFGDFLKKQINLLSNASKNKKAPNSFWIILRDIAVQDIILNKPHKVDSDIAIGIYYKILCDNFNKFPEYYQFKLKSNGQERFRVINRNLWSSNAFHNDGLANQIGIKASVAVNEFKKGSRIIFEGE
jgi:hypothetical protein